MNEEKKKTAFTKTQVFNVIILDRSGSMGAIRQAAIDGFNETLAGIRKAQEKFADTQEHYVSLVTFCGCETIHVFDKTPVNETHPLKPAEYEPCCSTPLYDAMGFTLTAMQKHVREVEDSAVIVTIITDGMENSSKEYTGSSIKSLVEELKDKGWNFTYMGANQDSVEVAMTLSIRNSRNFAYNEEGTRVSMRKDSTTRMNFFTHLARFKEEENLSDAPISAEERHNLYGRLADQAFDETEEETKS